MLKKVIENIIFVVLLVILGISISPALPYKNIPRTYVVVSGSMEPTIKTGSIVLTVPIDPKSVKTGDVVAFTSPQNSKDVILHRISGIKSESPLRFQTKGDNNNAPDNWDLMDVGVLGKQVYAVPYIGHIAAFVRTPRGFTLIIVLPALLFIISQILNIRKYIKEEIDKQVKNKTLPILFFFLSLFSVSSLFFTGTALAKLRSTATVSAITFSTKDFAPPSVPVLNQPQNNAYSKGALLIQSWLASTDEHGNPVRYEYQSCHVDPGMDDCPAGKVRWLETFNTLSKSATNVAESTFWWRVRSIDTLGNKSAWSPANKLTVDNTVPSSSLGLIPPSTNQNPLTIAYSEIDNNEIDHTDLCFSFNDPLFISETCAPNFNFTFEKGEGTYYFFTRATDKAGNIEVPIKNATNSIIYDITPPTTNLILNTGTTTYSGQNLLPNNNWTIIGNGSTFADQSALLGIGDSDSTDILIQQIMLPKNVSSNLSFSYNFTTADISDYDYLTVGISSGTGLTELFNYGGANIGWQTLSRSIAHWAGTTVDIFFKLINSGADQLKSTSVDLKNIVISPLDLRTGDTSPVEFLATDLGSGIDTSPGLINMTVGDTQINISSTDLATNVETTHSVSIVTLPPVVLNKITTLAVTLYNNTDSSVDLSAYTLDVGTTSVLSGTIPSFSSLDISVSVGTTQVGLLIGSTVVDFTTFDTLGSDTWQRQANGLGPWTRLDSPAVRTFDLQNRVSESKVTFTASGLGDTSIPLTYNIKYFANGSDQGIDGTILPHTIDSNHTVSRDFFLGTCSSGACIPATGIGSTFLVTFVGESKTFTFLP